MEIDPNAEDWKFLCQQFLEECRKLAYRLRAYDEIDSTVAQQNRHSQGSRYLLALMRAAQEEMRGDQAILGVRSYNAFTDSRASSEEFLQAVGVTPDAYRQSVSKIIGLPVLLNCDGGDLSPALDFNPSGYDDTPPESA